MTVRTRKKRNASTDVQAAGPAPQAWEAPEYDATTETALKLWVTLTRAYHAVGALARFDIAQHGLSPAEFSVLETLHHKGPLLLHDLQRKVLVSSGGITFLVDRLSQKGFVMRQACPSDRRARYAVLTREGRTLMNRVFPLHASAVRSALAGLSAAEQRAATPLLRRLGLAAAARVPVEAAPEAEVGKG